MADDHGINCVDCAAGCCDEHGPYDDLPADLLAALRVPGPPLPGEEAAYENVVRWTIDRTDYQRLIADRDRYKEALEKIARLDGRNYPHAEPVILFAREALDG